MIFYIKNDNNHTVLEFLFEEGMTWEKFINSKYNENNYFHIMGSIRYQTATLTLNKDINVNPNNKIIENAYYILIQGGHSGGS